MAARADPCADATSAEHGQHASEYTSEQHASQCEVSEKKRSGRDIRRLRKQTQHLVGKMECHNSLTRRGKHKLANLRRKLAHLENELAEKSRQAV